MKNEEEVFWHKGAYKNVSDRSAKTPLTIFFAIYELFLFGSEEAVPSIP